MKFFYQKQGSTIQTQQAYRRHYCLRDSPSFGTKSSSSDLLRSGRSCSERRSIWAGKGEYRNGPKRIEGGPLGLDLSDVTPTCFCTIRWGYFSNGKGHNPDSQAIFWKRIISLGWGLNLQLCSPNLTSPDFFLYDYLKENIYDNNTQTLQ